MKKTYLIVLPILCVAAVALGTVVGYCIGQKQNEERKVTDVSETSEAESHSYDIDDALDSQFDAEEQYRSYLENQQTAEEESAAQQEVAVSEETEDAAGEEAGEDKPMTVSIMGDSISTFRGYIPEEYHVFFPDNGAVSDVNDTWWKTVIDDLGLTLCTNASSSGSTCAGDSTSKSDPQSGCDDMRVNDLAGKNGEKPDIIIVYMGTNDLIESIPLGSNDGTGQVAEGNIRNFSDAYTLMLDKLHSKYPDAAIYCCTIAYTGTWGTDTLFAEFVNGVGEGLRAADYNTVIRQIAANKGASVIDLYNCGITLDNLQDTTADGVHPTPLGMSYIADKVKESLNSAISE